MLSDLVANIAATLQQQVGPNAPPVLLGEKHLREQGKPPRICFVARGGRGGPPAMTPGGAPGLPPEQRRTNVRRLWTRQLIVQAHVWAADPAGVNHYGAAETLLNQLVLAMHVNLVGSYQFVSEEPPEGDHAWTALGEVIVAQFRIDVPVEDTPLSSVAVTPSLTSSGH